MTRSEPPWKLEFYTRAGRKPVEEFLDRLKRSRPQDHKKILSKFAYFEGMGLRAAMDLKVVAPLHGYSDLYELRLKGTGFRFYGFTWQEPGGECRYLLVASAEEKAGRKADDTVIRKAADARTEWYSRRNRGSER